MSHESRVEALSKGGHLRGGDRVGARAVGDDHVGVVHHDLLGGAAEALEGLGQEDWASRASGNRLEQ